MRARKTSSRSETRGAPGARRERGELVERALAADPAQTQQDEAIADARGVVDLVNREEERAAGGGVLTQRRRHVAALPEVEAIERFVDEQDAAAA